MSGALVVAYRSCPGCDGTGCAPCLFTGRAPPIPSLQLGPGPRPNPQPAPAPADIAPPGVAAALEASCRARLNQQRQTFQLQAANAKQAHDRVVAELRAELDWLEKDRDALREMVKAFLRGVKRCAACVQDDQKDGE